MLDDELTRAKELLSVCHGTLSNLIDAVAEHAKAQDALSWNRPSPIVPGPSDIYAVQKDIESHTRQALRRLVGWDQGGHGNAVFFVLGAHRDEHGHVQVFNTTVSSNDDVTFTDSITQDYYNILEEQFSDFACRKLPANPVRHGEPSHDPGPHMVDVEPEISVDATTDGTTNMPDPANEEVSSPIQSEAVANGTKPSPEPRVLAAQITTEHSGSSISSVIHTRNTDEGCGDRRPTTIKPSRARTASIAMRTRSRTKATTAMDYDDGELTPLSDDSDSSIDPRFVLTENQLKTAITAALATLPSTSPEPSGSEAADAVQLQESSEQDSATELATQNRLVVALSAALATLPSAHRDSSPFTAVELQDELEQKRAKIFTPEGPNRDPSCGQGYSAPRPTKKRRIKVEETSPTRRTSTRLRASGYSNPFINVR